MVTKRSQRLKLTLKIEMKCLLLMVVLLMVGTVCLVEGKGLQIGVKKRPETCDMKSRKGDRLSMHYTVRSYNSLKSCYKM